MRIDYAEFARNYAQAVYRFMVHQSAWADRKYAGCQSEFNGEAADYWSRLCDQADAARDDVEDEIFDALARRDAQQQRAA